MYSQHDEEKYVLEAVGDKVGIFLDIGANDGRYLSNVLALIERGWSGIMVEANPVTFTRLVAHHGDNPKLDLVCAAIGFSSGLMPMWPAKSDDGLSTVNAKQRISRAAEANFGEPYFVAMVTLASLLSRFNQQVSLGIDVLSIDVEGDSVGLLLEFPFGYCRPKVIVVEHDGNIETCERCVESFRYKRVAVNNENLVFVRG